MTTFRRVVEAGSLSAAARGLRLSVGAVSRQISALEDDLGAQLLVRSTRRLTVTDEGRRFYDRCVRLSQLTEEARASVRGAGELRGTITMTAPVTLGLERVAPALRSFLAAHPKVEIELRLEDRAADVVGEGVHVAVRAAFAAPSSPLLIASPLMSSPRVLVASPRYLRARGRPRTPQELARHDALVQLTDTGPASLWHFRRGDEEYLVEVRGRLRANALLVLRDEAIHGLGVARLPEWLVRRSVADRTLRVVLAEYEVPPIPVFALYRVDLRGVARVRALLNHLRAALGSAE
jgi:DNA-binding transcriptional LysR family regulator